MKTTPANPLKIKPPTAPASPAHGVPQLPGINPSTKKDPSKVAQQLKDPSKKKMTKEVLTVSKVGQWKLHKVEDDKQDLYDIYTNGHCITDEPMSLDEIIAKFGSVRAVEAAGHRLVQHKED